MSLLNFAHGVFGLVVLIGIAFLFSNNKKKINWKLVRNGLILQLLFAVFVLKGEYLGQYFSPFAWPTAIFKGISAGFVQVLDFTYAGSTFVFGGLASSPGTEGSLGFFFAFQALTTIIFFAALMAVLYHLGVMQFIVRIMAWVMSKFMGTSGAESLSCAANIFVGQTEAPLMVKPYLKNMTKSELLTIMVGGMATIAGGVLASYIKILGNSYSQTMGIPLNEAEIQFATHLIGASVMAAPAALVISKIIFPETEVPETSGNVKVEIERTSSNVIEAAASGASDGLKLALNVAAMLIAFIALIALFNWVLGSFGDLLGINQYFQDTFGQPLSLQLLLGLVLQVVAGAIGVPWENAIEFGGLVGTKVVVNEFVAYTEMSSMISKSLLSNPKAILMATYALCGFANFSSMAILIGGLSPIAPGRTSDLSRLGLRAVLGGSLATLMTATMAGMLFNG